MDGDEKGQGAANDNARPADAGCSVEEPRRATGEKLERVVIDIARMIGRQMARVAANDNGASGQGRDEPEAE